MSKSSLFLPLLISLLVACGGSQLSQHPLRFSECGEYECARAVVPLDWECADGSCATPHLEVLIRRVPVRDRTTLRGQFWALDGGPGFSGEGFFDPGFIELVHRAGYDLYVPTHRGSPGSAGLSCPSEQHPDSPGGGLVTPEELPSCRRTLESQWGELEHFNSVAAGKDVAHLLSRSPAADRLVLFGGSYGTLWGQRVLQSVPDGFDLAIFDSVVDLESTLENADAHADMAARTLFSQCEASGQCPIDTTAALSVLQAHDEGRGCTDASGAELRALGFRFLSGSIQDRLVYVHLLAMAERCDEVDRLGLTRALTRARMPPSGGLPLPYSQLLNVHIVASELDGGQAPLDQSDLLASRGGDAALRIRSDAWGRVPLTVPLDSSSSARVVLFSGALDPLDPLHWAERTRDRWGAEHVVIPTAGHAAMRYARTASGNCAHAIFGALLTDPGAPIDASCLEQVEPIDWALEHETTQQLLTSWFGTR